MKRLEKNIFLLRHWDKPKATSSTLEVHPHLYAFLGHPCGQLCKQLVFSFITHRASNLHEDCPWKESQLKQPSICHALCLYVGLFNCFWIHSKKNLSESCFQKIIWSFFYQSDRFARKGWLGTGSIRKIATVTGTLENSYCYSTWDTNCTLDEEAGLCILNKYWRYWHYRISVVRNGCQVCVNIYLWKGKQLVNPNEY